MLSIVLLNYNMKGLLAQCVSGIGRTVGGNCEVIIVDNASTDGSRLLVSEWVSRQPFQGLTIRAILRGRNDGYAVGNNEGLRLSSGPLILILNPDIAVLDGAITALIEYAGRHPEAAVMGPKLVNPNKTLQYSCYRFPELTTPLYRRTVLGRTRIGIRHVREYMMMDWDHANPMRVDWIMGSAMLVRKEALEIVGGFDERFFMYFEDTDWCRRFWNSGYEVHYVPASVMAHYHQRHSAQTPFAAVLSRPTRAHMSSAAKYFLKYHRQSEHALQTKNLFIVHS